MGFKAIVIGKELKLRLAPRTDAKWVLKIPTKSNIHVDDCNKPGWLFAVYNQRLGYVMNKDNYLDLHPQEISYGVNGCQHYGEPDLHMGSIGKNVETLQHDLHSLQWKELAVDGEFGPKTQAAVKDYQEKNGLKPDGTVGVETKSVLYQDCFMKHDHNTGEHGHPHHA